MWSGIHAKDLLLVDEIGGLNAAIKEAASRSNLDNPSIEQVPAPSKLADTIALLFEETGAAPVAKVSSPLDKVIREADTLSYQLRGLNDPQNVYARMPYGLDEL